MAEKKAAAPKPKHVVGDAIEIPKGESILVLPDGTAVSVRRSYVAKVPGTYVVGKRRITVEEK